MGAALRMAGTWVVTTVVIVSGVNAAIERVARDVTVARPAPLALRDVDELLDERDATPSTTAEHGPTSTEPARATPTSSVGPTPTGSPGGPEEPGVPRPTLPSGRPDDAGPTTTTPRDPPERTDAGEGPRGP